MVTVQLDLVDAQIVADPKQGQARSRKVTPSNINYNKKAVISSEPKSNDSVTLSDELGVNQCCSAICNFGVQRASQLCKCCAWDQQSITFMLKIHVPSDNVHTRTAELDNVKAWANVNNLRLNLAKCAEIIFCDSRRKRQPVAYNHHLCLMFLEFSR